MKIIKICKCCGKEFSTCSESQLCCSRKCNGFLKRKRDIRICEWCNKEFEIIKSSPQRFCNEKCYGAWKSKNCRGDKASNWQGGDIIKFCQMCGKTCYVAKGDIEKNVCCSVECTNRWRKESGMYKGDKNPNWHGGKIIKVCLVCGKEFNMNPESNQKFCSRKCMGIWRSKNLIGEASSLWRGGKVALVCDYCGEEINRYKAELYSHNFCDKLCHDKWQKESGTQAGENSPCWKGGISFNPYCEKFNNDKKKEVRDKYDNCDYLTGIHRDICNKDKNGKIKELSVHHVDYNKMQGCEDYKWLLIPVSNRHNVMFNSNRLFWKKLILYALEYDKEYYNRG